MKINQIITWLLIIFLFLSISLFKNQLVLGQSPTEFRAEISNLRTRISRLENEVNRLSRSSSNRDRPGQGLPPGSFANPPIVNGQAIGRSDPMFERLATLLIELKEDVREIEQRLTVVEQKISEEKETTKSNF